MCMFECKNTMDLRHMLFQQSNFHLFLDVEVVWIFVDLENSEIKNYVLFNFQNSYHFYLKHLNERYLKTHFLYSMSFYFGSQLNAEHRVCSGRDRLN